MSENNTESVEGKSPKICHRHQLPVARMLENKLQAQQIIKQDLELIPCIGKDCIMWDSENETCFDCSGMDALTRISDAITKIYGIMLTESMKEK